LERADGLRRTRRYALELADTFLPAAFLQLFGDLEYGAGDKTELHEVADMITGYPFSSTEYVTSGDTIKLCRGANVLPDRIDWSDLAIWPKSETEKLEDYFLKSGDVVMAMDRPWISEGFKVAQIRPEDCPALLVQRVARLRGKDGVPNEFLYHLLRQPMFTRHCRPTETTIPHISPTEIRSFAFHLPPLPLQTRFAKLVERHERLRSAQRESLRQAEHLFQSLLHFNFSKNS
jgi:type I restriction enzyme S subunit